MNSHDQDPFGPVLQTMERLTPDAPLLGHTKERSMRRPTLVVASAFGVVLVVGGVALAIMSNLAGSPRAGDLSQEPVPTTTAAPESQESPTTTLPETAADAWLSARMNIVATDATALNERLYQAPHSGDTPQFDTDTLGTEIPFAPLPSSEIEEVADYLWTTSAPGSVEAPLMTWLPVYVGNLDGFHVAVRVVRERSPQNIATEYVCIVTFDADGGGQTCDYYLADSGSIDGVTQYSNSGGSGTAPVAFVVLSYLDSEVSVVSMSSPDQPTVWQRPIGGLVMFDTVAVEGSSVVLTSYDSAGVEIGSEVVGLSK